jgi:hypothetical protein
LIEKFARVFGGHRIFITKHINSAFNARGSRVTIVVVQVGAMKIYVTAVEALRKNERQDET